MPWITSLWVAGSISGVPLWWRSKISPFGGFWFDLDLPDDARLGDYQIRARLEHGTFTREFTVEEFRPATFEINGTVKELSLIHI